jgi:hypothetical protein
MPILDDEEIDALYQKYQDSGGEFGQDSDQISLRNLAITLTVSLVAWYGIIKLGVWLWHRG